MKKLFLLFFFISTPLVSQEVSFAFPEEQPQLHLHTKYEMSWWWPWEDDEPVEEEEEEEEEESDHEDESRPNFNIEALLKLEDTLNQKVIGQPTATKMTSEALIRYAAGINNPDSPIGTFLFIGPTGVGKTELAKQLNQMLFGSSQSMISFNMAEFTHEGGIYRLIGSDPGYINSEDGGQLTNQLKKHPFSVILLDEIEKAHPQVRKFFLQLLDEGEISEALTGDKISAKNCIIIMTSNIGALDIAQLAKQGISTSDIQEYLEPMLMDELSPELYNRLDPVLFMPLSQEVVAKVAVKMLGELADRLYKAQKVFIEYDQSIVEFLIREGYRPELGARPLKRLIENHLTTALARAVITGGFKKGDHLMVSYEDGLVHVKVIEPSTATAN